MYLEGTAPQRNYAKDNQIVSISLNGFSTNYSHSLVKYTYIHYQKVNHLCIRI